MDRAMPSAQFVVFLFTNAIATGLFYRLSKVLVDKRLENFKYNFTIKIIMNKVLDDTNLVGYSQI